MYVKTVAENKNSTNSNRSGKWIKVTELCIVGSAEEKRHRDCSRKPQVNAPFVGNLIGMRQCCIRYGSH